MLSTVEPENIILRMSYSEGKTPSIPINAAAAGVIDDPWHALFGFCDKEPKFPPVKVGAIVTADIVLSLQCSNTHEQPLLLAS